MGYIISSLTDPSVTPKILGEYCIYLIHEWRLKGTAKSLSLDFREYSTRLGSHASIFAASDEREYNESFASLFNGDSWFKITVGDYYDLPPGIIVTKPGLPQFSASRGDVFIYVSGAVINLAYHNPHSLSQDLVDLCRHNNNSFIASILKYSRGAIVRPGPHTRKLLPTLQDALIIEPNLNGIGIKPKPLIQFLRSVLHNPEEETPKYDCVIYQF